MNDKIVTQIVKTFLAILFYCFIWEKLEIAIYGEIQPRVVDEIMMFLLAPMIWKGAKMFFKCNHNWKVAERSNAIQQDNMGYPLRLCIVKCNKCGVIDQQWLDTDESALHEVKEGKSFILKWQ